MFGLNCNYYTKQFNTENELIEDVLNSGMDPNYEVTLNGYPQGYDLISIMS